MKAPLKPGGKFFRFLNGTDGFYWRGMATRTDLGAQPTDHPRLVVNGRYYGGRIVARRPLTDAVAVVPLVDAVDVQGDASRRWTPSFLAEHHAYRPVKIWIGGYQDGFEGGHVSTIDTDSDPEYRDFSDYYHGLSFSPRIERFANSVYVAEFEAVRRVYPIDQIVADPYSADYTRITPSDEVVVATPGYRVAALHLHEGRLYFVLTDPYDLLTGFIYSWDGYQTRLEYTLTVTGKDGASMATFRDHLVVTVAGWDKLLVKDASGTWTQVAGGGFGFNPSAQGNSMAALKEKLYIAGMGDRIYSWDGSNIAEEHVITGATGTPEATTCVGFNGRLYYGWGDHQEYGDPGQHGYRVPYIGEMDPDTSNLDYKWNDTYKGLGALTWWGAVLAMVVYRQRIVASVGVEMTSYGYTSLTSTIMSHVVENNPASEWHDVTLTQGCPGPFNVVGGEAMVADYMKVL